jgi:hypothetical protein
MCDCQRSSAVLHHCAVTVDEVYALGELYKKVSNSLHQVSTVANVAAERYPGMVDLL